MRIAILSDIHGNGIALEAVLADCRSQGSIDAYWLLGDLVAMGPDPVGVAQRLRALPNQQAIRGNTDRWLTDVHNEFPLTPEEISQGAQNNESAPLELAYSMVWTQGALTASGDLAWVAALPLDYRTVLPDGTRVLCVHASPGQDDGEGIRPVMSDAQVAAALAGAEADLIFVGHTHWALDRTVKGVRVVNLGSVSLQVLPDLRASYVLLDADERGHQVQVRKVDYDHEEVVAQLQTQRHPAYATISAFLQGQRRPFWEQ
ncbi:MAG: metallophosphoesterase family protein [Caldilineaceae bacterium]